MKKPQPEPSEQPDIWTGPPTEYDGIGVIQPGDKIPPALKRLLSRD